MGLVASFNVRLVHTVKAPLHCGWSVSGVFDRPHITSELNVNLPANEHRDLTWLGLGS